MDTRIIDEARKYLGYSAVKDTETVFGRRAGYPTLPWGGAFVDCVLFDAGVRGAPSFVNPHQAFAAMQARGELTKRPAPGDIILTSFGEVGILDGFGRDEVRIISVIENPMQRGRYGVIMTSISPQDILMHGRPKGFPHTGPAITDGPSPAQMRAEPERILKPILAKHPYTKGLRGVTITSTLYRWALLCGARPADAMDRRMKDEYLARLALEAGAAR